MFLENEELYTPRFYVFKNNFQDIEIIVFSRQFVGVLNPFIDRQQNWAKNTIFFM